MAHFKSVLVSSLSASFKKGSKIDVLALLLLFYSPILLQRNDTLHPSASAALLSLKAPHALAYRWCPLSAAEAHSCSVYCPCVHFERPPMEVLWKVEGIKRSLKITGPSAATPPPTPPIDTVQSLVWSWAVWAHSAVQGYWVYLLFWSC